MPDSGPTPEQQRDIESPPGRVAALRTRPETVLEDIGRAMELAGFREALPRQHPTLLVCLVPPPEHPKESP